MKIELKGPFTLLPKAGFRSVVEQPDAAGAGIYLWTVFYNDFYWVNYVGISTQCIVKRMFEHFSLFFTGKYKIYDAVKFQQREKTPVYENCDANEFKKQYPEIVKNLVPMLLAYHVFYYAVDSMNDRHFLEQIESTLIRRLQSASDDVRNFLDNIRISRADGVPVDLEVSFPGNCKIMGLEKK
jgi:hypothetical protein